MGKFCSISKLFVFYCGVSVVISDHYEWDFEISQTGQTWAPVLVGEPQVLISKHVTPHPEAETMESNNNIAGIVFNSRLFLAWRSAPVHFAGKDTRIYIVSSPDNGTSWDMEANLFYGRDLREPFFLAIDGKLLFSFFEGGTNPIDFEPFGLFRMERIGMGDWTAPELFGHDGEVIWEIVRENGTAFAQSYSGDYSTPGDPQDLGKLNMFLNKSKDGIDWEPEGQEIVYHGGLTELGFNFDLDGNMWGVGRNEDGDDSGWGSRTFFAEKEDLSNWQFISNESYPWIYESPKMFRHGSDLYLVARTDPGGPFWSKENPLLNILPAWEHHLYDLVEFSFRQHGTAIWRLNQESGSLEPLLQLEGCGDTAFPSIIRLSLHEYLILNYSSPFDACPANWLE